MNSEVEFFKKLGERRVQITEVDRPGFNMRVVLYVNAAVNYAEAFDVSGLPVSEISITDDAESIQESLFLLEAFLDKLKARNIFELEPNLDSFTVLLDDNWRAQASTFVSHIRKVVEDATMPDSLREGIMKSLNRLQNEIDRRRTRTDATAEVWIKVTQAIGTGAKNLDPAVKLIEKLTKNFGKARQHQIEAEQKASQLPPPDDGVEE